MGAYDDLEIEEPSDFLVSNIDIITKGKVLDLAMGRGRNAIYLALNGFEVDGIDVSGESIDAAVKIAKKNNVKINTTVGDLEKDFVIPSKNYDVIICFNYLQRSLIYSIKEGIKPGGMVVYETYIVDQAELGKPKNPDHLLRHNELLAMFNDFRCLRYREGIFNKARRRVAIASIIAQKE